MGILQIFPTLLIPALIYAMVALPSGDQAGMAMAATAFDAPLASGGTIRVTWGNLLIMFSTLVLFIEVVKSTQVSQAQMIDNGLSMAVFVLCFVLFLLAKPFGTAEFLIIVLMTLLDFMAGMVIATKVAQRTVAYDR